VRTLEAIVTRGLAPLDATRSFVLRRAGRRFAFLFADRAARTTLLGALGVLFALVVARHAPLVALALGPIVLGVPHLIADVRYLVVRRGLHRRRAVVLLTLIPLALSLVLPTLELAGVVTLGAALAARGAIPRRIAVALLGLALCALGVMTGLVADIVFGHLHNVIAIGLWWWMRPRTRGFELVVPLMIVLSAFALCITTSSFTAYASVLPIDAMIFSLSPVADFDDALTWVSLFAFGQMVHYAVWLRLMPEDARATRAPRPFVSSFRALLRDFGAGALLVAIGIAIAIAVYACVDVVAARDAYLRLALFHGPMEVAFAGLAYAEARRP
jgi:hypothetical protein